MMKRISILCLAITCFYLSCQKETKIDYNEFLADFYESKDSLEIVSYRIRRIDTFADGNVWDNKGFAHLEKNTNDSIFGFDFYAKRDDVPQISIYDQHKNFDLDMNEMYYELSPGGTYFTGSPGGQMVSTSFFFLDEVFESARVEPSENGYILTYKYPDDSLYMVTNRKKVLELNEQLLPVRLQVSSLQQDAAASTTLLFSDVKFNDQVASSMDNYKELIKDYTLLEPEEYVPSDYLGTPLPAMNLTNIKTGETGYFKSDKVVLIDFWEVWCGWCIKSFPKVEELAQTYKDDLQVIGIATESKDKALDLIQNKGITFDNYFQDEAFLKKFNIRSWPTYLLVSPQGIIVKEYFGFDEAIEEDLKILINEQS